MARLALLAAAAVVILLGLAAGLAYTRHYGSMLVEIVPTPNYTRSIIVNAERIRVGLQVERAPTAPSADCEVNVTILDAEGRPLSSHTLHAGGAFEARAPSWPLILVAHVAGCEGVARSWLRVTVLG
jgi:hypothetical protein